ncbi:MAG: cell division protein FtsA [Campylobacteraceae bacterium]|jgi:cell division protein FtsA|nr:cell division protein FtsA [Campylobacteraceae bacterium]
MLMTILGIDIGSTKICAIIAQKSDIGDTKILGVGVAKSQGLKKGVITNIDLASKSIKSAISEAKRAAGMQFERVIVSVSGSYVKSMDSSGIVNIPNRDIGIKEITRAMQMADYNANATIPQEHEKLHVLPYNFIVDDQSSIEDPLGMNGGRLEVQVHIVTAQRSSLINLKKAVKLAGIEIDNLVLNSYASSIAVLSRDEKELGVAVVDLGGATCNLAVHVGNSVRYNDFLGIGSANITNDLSMALHTPINSADETKIKYGSLKNISGELIKLPLIGDEHSTHEVSLEMVSNVIYARVEETLAILSNSLNKCGYKDKIGAGVVLTGGMTKLEGIRELAAAIFNMPVRIAKPKEMEGLFEILRDPGFATAVGLVLYGSGYFTPYEIDSNKKLRYRNETLEEGKNINTLLPDDDEDSPLSGEDLRLEGGKKLSSLAEIDKKPNRVAAFFQSLWRRLTQLF